MSILSSRFVLALVSALCYYLAGAHEARFGGPNSGLAWAVLSVAVSALVVVVLHGSWGLLLVAQIGLFVGIGVFRALRDKDSGV